MKTQNIKVIIIMMFLALLIESCTQQPEFRLGVSQCSDDDWRKKMNEEILREVMLHDGVEVEIRSANDDSQKQIQDLDYFVKNDFDIIIVSPNEANALTPKIKEIYNSGKPIILFDRNIHGDTYTAFQGADNHAIGRDAAKIINTLTPRPCILEIMGLYGSTPAELRHKGFREAIDSLGYEVVAEAYGNWNYDEAKHVADSLLIEHPEANVFYAHNDRMAIAAKDVAIAHGRNDIKVIGIDAAPNIGIKAVKDGKIDATFLYPTFGDKLVTTALDILNGRNYEHNLILPTKVPVTADNADILLTLDKALRNETDKIVKLQATVKSFSHKYSMQSTVLFSTIIILVLLAGIVFLLLRSYWISKKHHSEIEKQNEALCRQRDELARQRDELDKMYVQLQEATSSKLSWFTNVSHDLRTPLTLIAEPVHQIAHSPNLNDSERKLMQIADRNVLRLQRLVNQILDIRKYDNEQLKLNLVNIEVSKTLAEWTAAFVEHARKNHINFNVEYLPTAEIVIALDIEKCERVMFNLLSNAFKFTPENGTITVTIDRNGNSLIYKVSDTGIGIPPEDINNIFNQFFSTDKINPNGSGIGLALTKVFVEMHGGSISVESNVGVGSTFTVVLPIRAVDSEPKDVTIQDKDYLSELEILQEDDEAIPVDENTPTVLVVDDNRDICTLVKGILSDEYTVITALSGAQGVRMANKYLPDLIICDVMMPGMDGYQVCQALKSDSLTAHIPILLLTACSRDEQRIEGYEYGADAYMSKPFDSAILRARCKSLITNRERVYQNLDHSHPTLDANAKKEKAPRNNIHDEFLQRFVEIIEQNLANTEISVEDIADKMGLSRVQLYRKIKALTNYSVAEMIRNIRLKRAAIMLKTSDVTVSEVAYSVGFSSPSYFSRCYKDYFGESPVDTQNRTSKKR